MKKVYLVMYGSEVCNEFDNYKKAEKVMNSLNNVYKTSKYYIRTDDFHEYYNK